jgi:hypothetical protein
MEEEEGMRAKKKGLIGLEIGKYEGLDKRKGVGIT